MVIQEAIFTRHGTDRILRYAFDLARRLPSRHVTSATKSNGLYHSMPFWDERFAAIQKEYPDVAADQYHVDILAARFVMSPERFSVVVGSNLFGDILSDLGPGVTGTIAVAPSGNINPERIYPSMFEPVHAPRRAWGARDRQPDRPGVVRGDDAGASGRAGGGCTHSPCDRVCLAEPERGVTSDMGGQGTTQSLGDAIVGAL